MASADGKSPAVEVEVGDRDVRISNPDRVYFPATGATKLDLVRYYLSVGDGIVNALRERPCMLHRFPTGVERREGPPEAAARRRAAVGRDGARPLPALQPRRPTSSASPSSASVIWAVQMSTVEFHPWNSRRADTEKPDEWRIDLDPMPLCDFATVRRVAHVAHEVLDELGAVGWPKTSGGKGMHVYVRIEPDARLRGRTSCRAGLRPRGRAAGGRRRDDHLVAQGPRPGDAVRRLQPERPRPHHRLGLQRPRQRPRHGVDAHRVARDRRRAARRLHDRDRARRATPSKGDLHAGIDDAVFSIEPLLEWADRDERDGKEGPADPDD